MNLTATVLCFHLAILYGLMASGFVVALSPQVVSRRGHVVALTVSVSVSVFPLFVWWSWKLRTRHSFIIHSAIGQLQKKSTERQTNYPQRSFKLVLSDMNHCSLAIRWAISKLSPHSMHEPYRVRWMEIKL